MSSWDGAGSRTPTVKEEPAHDKAVQKAPQTPMIHSSRKQRFVKPGLDLTSESEIKQVLEQILVVQWYLVRQLTKLVNILFHSQASLAKM